LISLDADIECFNNAVETPILCGARKKHTKCVKMLLDRGANINALDKKGNNLMHIVVAHGYQGMYQVLQNRPEHLKLLRKPNIDGATPLDLYAKNKDSLLALSGFEPKTHSFGQALRMRIFK